MQPAIYDLDIYRGDSGHWQFKLWQDQAMTAPVDLTGVIAKSEIRDRPAGTTVVELACTITLPNIIDLQLDALDSEALPPSGVWDLQLTYPSSGEVFTPVAGVVMVTADVTDSTAHPAFHAVEV